MKVVGSHGADYCLPKSSNQQIGGLGLGIPK